MSVFVDSSAFYAAIDKGDGAHDRARRALSEAGEYVTTDHVVTETWSLVQLRLGWHVAEQFWSGIRAGAARVEIVLATDLDAAWSIGEAWPDQGFSMVDRTSFAVMERLGIDRVASFDRDFAIYRFGRRRERAFEIVG